MEQVIKNNESIEHYNNSLIQKLGEFSDEFEGHADAINRVFYYYIQNCLHRNDEVFIEQNEVYKILEVVEFLRKLKYEKQSNN